MLTAKQTFPVPAFRLVDTMLAFPDHTRDGYRLTLLHDASAPDELWIEARSSSKGRTGEAIVSQCWRAAVITLDETSAGETVATLHADGEDAADQWEILGGSEADLQDSTYLLHQLTAAHTFELVLANWWEVVRRDWWERLTLPNAPILTDARPNDEAQTTKARPWEAIPEEGWNREAVKLAWEGYPGTAIAKRVSVAHKTALNRLSDLRKIYGPEVVPFLRKKPG